jgi:signal transduction histidine kinase
VQKIVVLHNGRVVAANHPGGGARFEITLPVSVTS